MDPSIRKRFKTCDKLWSDLNHDVLFLVMMQLDVIGFVAFSGVCKSWRSFALSNGRKFMASTPPVLMRLSDGAYQKECHIEDFEGRKYKTLIPHSARRTCLGLTCGYLILCGDNTRDFCLVNPITKHELYFPNSPLYVHRHPPLIKAIVVFSPTISRWVFITLDKLKDNIWYSIVGKGVWNLFYSTLAILDIHAFKGKIYTINTGWEVYELKLVPELKLKLLEINENPKPPYLFPEFLSSSENLYAMNHDLQDQLFKVYELDFDEMKWVSPENTIGEYAFFISNWKSIVANKPKSWVDHRPRYERYDFLLVDIKPESWADHWPQYEKDDFLLDETDKIRKDRFVDAALWYFPHEFINVNLIDE